MNSSAPEFETRSSARTLAQIESDLFDAERALAEADARLQEAKRKHVAALERISRYQLEFDEVVAARRRLSAHGTRWHNETAEDGDDLVLQPEDMEVSAAEPEDSPTIDAASVHFDRLRAHVISAANGSK